MDTIFRSWEFRLCFWIFIFFLTEVKSLCQFWVTMQAQSHVGKRCPWPSTGKGHKAKANWEEAQLCRAPAECWRHCPGPRQLANWFLSQCANEQNENFRQKITGNGYQAAPSLSGAKSTSAQWKDTIYVILAEKVVTEGWQLSLPPLCTFPHARILSSHPPDAQKQKHGL